MTTARFLVVDVDSGPGGGGGATALAALCARGATVRGLALDALVAGIDPETMRCVDFVDQSRFDSYLVEADDAVVLPATRRALQLMSARNIASRRLRRLLAEWHGRDHVLAGADLADVVASRVTWSVAPTIEDLAWAKPHAFILDATDALHPAAGLRMDWYRLRRAAAEGAVPARLIGDAGDRLVELGFVVRKGRLAAAAAVLVQQSSPSGRTALAWSIADDGVVRLAERLAASFPADGIKSARLMQSSYDDRLRVASVAPIVPDWLAIHGTDGGPLMTALTAKRAPKSPLCGAAGFVYSALPLDHPVTAREISARMIR